MIITYYDCTLPSYLCDTFTFRVLRSMFVTHSIVHNAATNTMKPSINNVWQRQSDMSSINDGAASLEVVLDGPGPVLGVLLLSLVVEADGLAEVSVTVLPGSKVVPSIIVVPSMTL